MTVKIQALEFSELSPRVQKKVRERELEHEVEYQLEFLDQRLQAKEITIVEYWAEVGCSQHYGESTPWFVPSVYYENHVEVIEENVNMQVEAMLYNENGTVIGNKDDAQLCEKK